MKSSSSIKFLAILALLCSQVLFLQSPAQAALEVASQPLSSGSNSTCVIRAADDLYCVGANTFGQLGNGNNISSSDPQKVSGISHVAQVSVGATSACAITRAGVLYCWGDNSSGQLGIGNTDSKNVATLVNLPNVAQVTVGLNFACALTKSQTLYCWGANDFGQLTNDTKQSSNIPVVVSQTPNSITAINANGKRICAIASAVFCWGEFASFVFPNESRNWMPARVLGSAGAKSVSLGGDFGCIAFASSVSCWGANGHGQLGNGTKAQSSDLSPVSGISSVSQLATGEHFACALDESNDSYCWGENAVGQLGINAGADQVTRIPTGAAKAVAIDAGLNSLCALKLLDGSVGCVGDVTSGQSGYLLSSQTPLLNGTASSLVKISSGATTTCAINTAGLLACWGTLVPGIPEYLSFTDVSVGNASACAVTTTKAIYCWGSNSSGQLGDNTSKSATMMVPVASAINNFVHVAVGFRHACGVTTDGLVYCWGDNSKQQLGSAGADTKAPKAVPGIGTASTIAVGDYHTCVQQLNGAVTCWGDNSKKQINATATSPLSPIDLVLTKPISSYSLGSYNTCLLDTSKGLQCYGDNSKKQSPGNLVGSFTSVSAGANTVCVINTDNKTLCFGAADSAKLGNTSVDTATPKEITGVTALSLSVGLQHVCALSTTGTLSCWGSNASGQLASSFGFPSAFSIPTITVLGTLALGETLTTFIDGTETNSTFTYLWTRASAANGSYSSLTSQTASTYVSSGIDLGRYYVVEVKQSKWGITSTSYQSKPVGPVGPAIRLLLTPMPSISGVYKVSKFLITRPGRWDSGVSLSYQWYRGSTLIKGATKANYQLAVKDIGKQIYVAVTGVKTGLPKVTVKSQKTVKIIR